MQFGFDSWEQVEKYLGIQFDTNEEEPEDKRQRNNDIYDFVLVDIDDNEKLQRFEMIQADKNYFVTSFDMYSLNKGMKIFQDLDGILKLTKVLFSYDNITKEEEDYLNTISIEYGIQWNDFTLYFQIFGEDNKVIQENQRLEKVRFKKLSSTYKDSLVYIVQDITGIQNFIKLKKLMKD